MVVGIVDDNKFLRIPSVTRDDRPPIDEGITDDKKLLYSDRYCR
jgi:hypothetical protein